MVEYMCKNSLSLAKLCNGILKLKASFVRIMKGPILLQISEIWGNCDIDTRHLQFPVSWKTKLKSSKTNNSTKIVKFPSVESKCTKDCGKLFCLVQNWNKSV